MQTKKNRDWEKENIASGSLWSEHILLIFWNILNVLNILECQQRATLSKSLKMSDEVGFLWEWFWSWWWWSCRCCSGWCPLRWCRINVRICWTNTHPIDPRTHKSLSTDNDGNLKSHINLTGDVKTNSSSCQAIVCWILSRDSDLVATPDENSQKCVTSYHSSNESWSSTNKWVTDDCYLEVTNPLSLS